MFLWMFVNIAMPHLHFIMYYMPHPHITPASSASAPFGGSSMPDLCSFFKPSPIKAHAEWHEKKNKALG